MLGSLSAPFFIFVVATWAGPEVGDGGGHHQNVGVGRVLGHRVAKLGGRTDVHHLDPGRVGQARGVAGDQRHLGTALGGHPGHRVALLAGTAVADEAHRVDRLAGAARGDQDLDAREVVRQRIRTRQQQLGEGGDLLGFGQPAGSGVGAGQPARRGFEHHRATLTQRGHVLAGGRVQPHLGVHGGREQHRTARGQQRGGQQIIGAAGDRAGQHIGGGRRHDHQVGLLADAHVRHLVDVVEDPGVHRDSPTAPRTWRRRRIAAPTRWGPPAPDGRPR